MQQEEHPDDKPGPEKEFRAGRALRHDVPPSLRSRKRNLLIMGRRDRDVNGRTYPQATLSLVLRDCDETVR
jgi:hypothetical protein